MPLMSVDQNEPYYFNPKLRSAPEVLDYITASSLESITTKYEYARQVDCIEARRTRGAAV